MRRHYRALHLIIFTGLMLYVSGAFAVGSTGTGSILSATSAGAFLTDPNSASPAAAVAAGQDGADSQGRVRRPPAGGQSGKSGQPKAVPREQPKPKADTARERERAEQGRPAPPPRRADVPHRYFSPPHAFAFAPVDLRLGYYYHPYFGFYFGPYYGPFYPYPGPYPYPARYSAGSIRLKVKPVETEVYLNGYYAGIVDDFDGVFQRLYVPAGGHHIELRLDGYESYRRDVYVALGDSLDVTHVMQPAKAGTRPTAPPAPSSLPEEWTAVEPQPAGGQPASPYGILAIRTDPADAQIVIDDEAWMPIAGQHEFLIHLPAGWHRLEVRKSAFRTFTTTVELSQGQTTRLDVRLEP